MNQYRRGIVALSLAVFVTTQASASAVIGVASTRGTIEVDNASVRGTANLTDGSMVRTNETAGQVQLNNGVQATFGKNTAASVYNNRIEIREGSGQVATRPGFELGALGFRVAPAGDKAVARVSYSNPERILVTAVGSPVQVSRDGVLLARLNPGTTYFFEPEAGDTGGGTARTAGQTAGKAADKTGAAAVKTGLSVGAKWGIVGAVAAGSTVGLGVGLSGEDASR
jgi:hypothetical protein